MNTPQEHTPAGKSANTAANASASTKANTVDAKDAKVVKATKAKTAELPAYIGPEQRKEQRRQANDRRDYIRYELKNDGRRLTTGRRATDKNPWIKYQG